MTHLEVTTIKSNMLTWFTLERDALHVYGTNQQTDQYNSIMLQKLTTHKHIIKSSEIRKDRNTGQVELSLEGKERTETGGLSGTLTVAENAFIRLTSNIDVANGLANGVRGIIRSIITNDQQSVTAILVQFDNKSVGEKAKASSQYKCEGLKPPLESFSRIDHAVIVMSNNY